MSDPATEIGRQPLEVTAYGITDTGRVRSSNEDQFLIAELTKTMRIVHTSLPEPKARFGDERGHLFLVADGMGGTPGRRTGERSGGRGDRAVHAQHLQVVLSRRTVLTPSASSRSSRRRCARPMPASSRNRPSILS
jgi:hypothetical protein